MDALAGSAAATVAVDWDEAAGEAWGRLVLEGDVVALVSAKLPLMFVAGKVGSLLGSMEGLVTVEVPALDAPVLQAGLDVLSGLFGSGERFHLLDPEGFSANDLWYATV
ncbi:MAG: hypothetical protein ACJ73S_15045 [Mycobacteriales bacterium]